MLDLLVLQDHSEDEVFDVFFFQTANGRGKGLRVRET